MSTTVFFYETFDDAPIFYIVEGDYQHLQSAVINTCAPQGFEGTEEEWNQKLDQLQDVLFEFRDGHGNVRKYSEQMEVEKKALQDAEEEEEEVERKPYDKNDPDAFHYREVHKRASLEEVEAAIRNGARIVVCGFVP